jgi:hypothetical protein
MNFVPVISILVSFGAFAFSLYSWRERVRQDQRDLFFKLHEHLVGADQQRGRRILYRQIHCVEDAQVLLRENPLEYDLANMALATLDIAALYVERNYIDEKTFMEEWGYTYKDIFEHARSFITERLERNAAPHPHPLGHFHSFALKATDREWPEIDTSIAYAREPRASDAGQHDTALS